MPESNHYKEIFKFAFGKIPHFDLSSKLPISCSLLLTMQILHLLYTYDNSFIYCFSFI